MRVTRSLAIALGTSLAAMSSCGGVTDATQRREADATDDRGGDSTDATADRADGAAEAALGAACVLDGSSYASGSAVVAGCNLCLCKDGSLTQCTNASCSFPLHSCRAPWDCPQGFFCLTGSSCDFEGVCVAQPKIDCGGVDYDPVCECWGATATNACYAVVSGNGVRHVGPCSPSAPCTYEGRTYNAGVQWEASDGLNVCRCVEGQVICSNYDCRPCGGALGDTCGPDEYCAYSFGNGMAGFGGGGCGIDGGTACCRQRPMQCYSMEAPTVCGCDGQRYENFCYAALAGTGTRDCTFDSGTLDSGTLDSGTLDSGTLDTGTLEGG